LQAIEATATGAGQDITLQTLVDCGLANVPFVLVTSYRGMSMSRVTEGIFVGSAEFEDARPEKRACWPDGFSDHYVDQHDVVPTLRFRSYVQDFDLEAFRRAVADARACGGGSGASASAASPGAMPAMVAAAAATLGSIEEEDTGACEGYFPPESVCLPLGAAPRPFTAGVDAPESRGCPQRRARTDWAEKAEFLEKLRAIEATATGASQDTTLQTLVDCGLANVPFVLVTSYRGMAMSRVAEGMFVGSAEFEDARPEKRACWPDGFSDHYVDQHDVVPTLRFRSYVRDFDLEAFRRAVTDAQTCGGGSGASSAASPGAGNRDRDL